VYQVFDIPGKYLKKADLLFALTGAAQSKRTKARVSGFQATMVSAGLE